MPKTIADIMGIQPDMRTYLHHAPAALVETIDFPRLDISTTLTDKFDYIHAFCDHLNELQHQLTALSGYLHNNGILWLSFPETSPNQIALKETAILYDAKTQGLKLCDRLWLSGNWASLKFMKMSD